jgi:hypothetical protein
VIRTLGEPFDLNVVTLQRVVHWIEAIPFESWPQQHRLLDGRLRPAMVTDLSWMSFGERTDELVRDATPPAMRRFRSCNRLLSVVMPGATIDPHVDELGADWMIRIHVPLLTNPDAIFISGDVVHRMEVRRAYEVDTRARHSVWNSGPTPRVHLMFDLHEG